MKQRMVFSMVLLLGFTPPALGDYYRYADGTGTLLYTDDLNRVPADLRHGAERITSSPGPESGAAPGDASSPDAGAGAAAADRARLAAKKAILEQTYHDLTARSARLDTEGRRSLTEDQRESLDRQRLDLNREIRNYELERQILEAEIETLQETLRTAEQTEALSRMQSELKEREALLQTEQESLLAEKSRIQQMGRSLATEAETQDDHRRMEAFNARLADYEARRQAFEDDNAAFIEQVRSKGRGPEAAEAGTGTVPPAPGEGAGFSEDLAAVREALRQTESDLHAALQSLAAEKQAIEAERASVQTYEQVAAFNERIQAFTDRMNAYLDRRQVFEADIAAYNARVLGPSEATRPEGAAPPAE